MQSIISIKGTHAESQSHKIIKHLLYDFLYKETDSIENRALEKYLGNRFADIYFKLKDGKYV